MIAVKRYWQYVSFTNMLSLLLFLYPLFATVMRHWNSSLFALIMLLGLIYFFTKRKKDNIVLHKYEKVFLWLLAGNFFVFLLTSLLNLPEDTREIRFDIEARFLLIIPLYFLLIKSDNAMKWLGPGAALSVFIALGYCIYDIVYINGSAFTGIYSHLYTAPVLLIYTVIGGYYLLLLNECSEFVSTSMMQGKRTRSRTVSSRDAAAERTGTYLPRVLERVLLPCNWIRIRNSYLAAGMTLAALYTIYYTYSRVTYFAMLAVTLLVTGFLAKGWWKPVAIAVILLFVFLASLSLENVKSRMSIAYNEYSDYMALDTTDDRVNAEIVTSVGTRLEMWRIAPLVLRDHTLFGVGNGNYKPALQEYIDTRQLNKVVAQHAHAHNVFVNVLVVKGLLGLLITCLVLFYPLYIYIKTFRQSQATAILGIMFVTIIFLVSMNETAPFVKSNFVATYLLLSLVIFQNHMRHIRSYLNG